MNITEQEKTQLIEQAIAARGTAYCPHSTYAVGAAVLTTNGHIITGANVEPASLRLGCCAEQLALLSAVAHGHRKFKALALVTDDGQTPCGSCRQLIYELCGDIAIIIAKPDKTYTISSTTTLLPLPFKKEPCCK